MLHVSRKNRATVCAAVIAASGIVVEQASAQTPRWIFDGGTSTGVNTGLYTPSSWTVDTAPAVGSALEINDRLGTDALRVVGTSLASNTTSSLFFQTAGTSFFVATPSIASMTFGGDTFTRLPSQLLNIYNSGSSAATGNQTLRLTGDSDGYFMNVKSFASNLIRIDRVNFGTLDMVLQGTGVFNVTNAATTLELEANISGSAGLVKTGAGTLFVSPDSAATPFQTFTGGVDIRGGKLRVSLSSALGPTSNTITIRDAGVLQYESTGTVPAARQHVLDGPNSTFAYGGTGLTIGGLISGTGALNKTGTGVLSLGGTNSFTGGINVKQGSLYINSPITDTADIVVANGATVGGNSTYNTANIRLGGLLDPGPSGVVGTFTTTGNVVLTDGTTAGVLRTGFTVTGQHDLLNVGGNLNITGGGVLLAGLASANDAVIPIINYGSLTGGAFATFQELIGGYTLDYNFGGLKQIALVRGNTTLFFNGSASTDFNVATNFSNDATNTTAATQTPTATADVAFVNNGNLGNYNAVIGNGTTYVNSLTFSSTTPTSISQAVSGSGTLVTRASSGANLPVGTGILVTTGAASVTINAPLAPNTNQAFINNSTNTLSLSGAVTLGSSLALTIGGSGATTINGVISGSGGLTAAGSGVVTLTGLNTYLGTTTVNKSGGSLKLTTNSQPQIFANFVAATNTGGIDVRNGAASFNSQDADIIKSLLVSGYATGFTTGIIRSSTANATRGLGYADNGAGEFIVKAAFYGDADLDGGVSINDFNTLAGNFGAGSGKVWTDGDFDYDGGVSINDFNLLAGAFGQSLPATSEAWAGLLAFAAAHDDLAAFAAITGVPEPTSLGLLAAGATLGLRRRRR